MIAVASLCVVLSVLATILVRQPGAILGAGPIVPEATARERNPDLLDATSVLQVAGDAPQSLALAPMTIALTFDDGPSPEWTPKVQAVLDEFGVPGTFFVIGENVGRHPDIVRALHDAGHEIGNHSYSHPEMGTISAWQAVAQIRLTDRLIAGITGERPTTFRPPYSGSAVYLPPDEYDAAKTALGDSGRLLVLSDHLPADYDESLTIDEVVQDALPTDGRSAVITLHDAGGDRSRTVEALRVLIPRLQAQGYRFVRASDIVDPTVAPTALAPRTDQNLGRALLVATSGVLLAFGFLRYVAIAGVVLGLLRIAVLLFFARRFSRRAALPDDAPAYVAPVTVIIPAHNEEVGIEAAVRSIAVSDYPDVRIIVVDDGSTDATSAIVRGLGIANVTLIRQANAGKPTALNTGIAAATTEIVVLVDGDTIFDPNTIRDVVQPFRDPEVGAVAGNAKVGNRGTIITRMQHVEYTVASEIERRMYGVLGVSACVPGAIGAFRASALAEAGGISTDTLAEDSDLTVSLARLGWVIDYVPTARAWTEAPSSLSSLLRQRRRWSYGVLQVMYKHRGALVERGRGGRLARITFPYQLAVSYLLAIFAPAIDLVLLHDVVFDSHSRVATLAIWTGLNVINSAVNLYALRLDGERFRSVWWVAFAQQFVYRQVLYTAALRSIATAVVGVRMPWQTPRRVGGLVSAERVAPGASPARTVPTPDVVFPPPVVDGPSPVIHGPSPVIHARPRTLTPVAVPPASPLLLRGGLFGAVRLDPVDAWADPMPHDRPLWPLQFDLRTIAALLGQDDEADAVLARKGLTAIGRRLDGPAAARVPAPLDPAWSLTSVLGDGGPFVLARPVLSARPVLDLPANPTEGAPRRSEAAPAPSWGDIAAILAAHHVGLVVPPELHLVEPVDGPRNPGGTSVAFG